MPSKVTYDKCTSSSNVFRKRQEQIIIWCIGSHLSFCNAVVKMKASQNRKSNCRTCITVKKLIRKLERKKVKSWLTSLMNYVTRATEWEVKNKTYECYRRQNLNFKCMLTSDNNILKCAWHQLNLYSLCKLCWKSYGDFAWIYQWSKKNLNGISFCGRSTKYKRNADGIIRGREVVAMLLKWNFFTQGGKLNCLIRYEVWRDAVRQREIEG